MEIRTMKHLVTQLKATSQALPTSSSVALAALLPARAAPSCWDAVVDVELAPKPPAPATATHVHNGQGPLGKLPQYTPERQPHSVVLSHGNQGTAERVHVACCRPCTPAPPMAEAALTTSLPSPAQATRKGSTCACGTMTSFGLRVGQLVGQVGDAKVGRPSLFPITE